MGLYAALNLYLPPPALSGSGALRCYDYGFSVMLFRDKYNVKLITTTPSMGMFSACFYV